MRGEGEFHAYAPKDENLFIGMDSFPAGIGDLGRLGRCMGGQSHFFTRSIAKASGRSITIKLEPRCACIRSRFRFRRGSLPLVAEAVQAF